MKIFRFIALFFTLASLFVYLETSHGHIPPLGELVNPNNGFWENYEEKGINLDEEIELDGIHKKVSIVFDEYSIPHIYANNNQDIYFAQGFITAHHRLWQMDFQTRITSGRLSEIFGSKLLRYDRKQRRRGLARAAAKDLMCLKSDSTYQYIVAFTKGVNAYIERVSNRTKPIEYKLLGYEPEEWTPLKTLLVFKQLSFNLSGYERDFEYSRALQLLGKDTFNLLFPDWPKDLQPVVDRDFSKLEIGFDLETPDSVHFFNQTFELMDRPSEHNGSNSFVIAGSRTANEKTIMAAQPDLDLYMPSFWYLVHLNGPSLNVFGASFPGIPGVIIGFNDSIAWSNSNSERDVVDWYKINYVDGTKEEYHYDDKRLKTQKVVERFSIRDTLDFLDTIIYTHYGPVVYDSTLTRVRKGVDFAMKWIGHEPSRDLRTLFSVNIGNNLKDFERAFDHFTSPPQNYSVMTMNGEIAQYVMGKFPIKRLNQGKFILNGSESANEWLGFIPNEHRVQVINPDNGFLASANQHPTNKTYPYPTFSSSYEVFRNRRINDRLNVLLNVRIDDVMALQNDNFNYLAFEALPNLLPILNEAMIDSSARKYRNQLMQWDFFNGPSRVTPIIFEVFWNLMYDTLWSDIRNDSVRFALPSEYQTIKILERNISGSGKEDKRNGRLRPERIDSIAVNTKNLVIQAFTESSDSLDQVFQETPDINWAQFKGTYIKHFLGSTLSAFNIENIPIGGGDNMVNAAQKRHGPSLRLIVEFGGNEIKAWAIYPGSQTGNPLSKDYGNMVQHWAQGKYYPMHFSSENELKLTKNSKVIRLTTE